MIKTANEEHIEKLDAMPERWRDHFPRTEEEADAWKPRQYRGALARQVLCVAQSRIEGAWGAYCDAVPGRNHKEEMGLVLGQGVKLPEDVARLLFPHFEGVPYAG